MEEDFEVPIDAIDLLEIIINKESRTFRYVTDLTQTGIHVTKDEIILDGEPREFDFYSVVRVDKIRQTVEFVKTHTRCFGIAVLVDELLELGEEDEEDEIDKNNMSYE